MPTRQINDVLAFLVSQVFDRMCPPCIASISFQFYCILSIHCYKNQPSMITEWTFFLPSGLSIIALVSVEGYHGYLLFVWIYGIFLGGYQFSLKVYTLEKVRVRQFPRGWGFVQGIKFLPILLGIPGLATNSMLFCLLFGKKNLCFAR